MSNSAIGFIQIVYGPTGPTGARGRTGPTGPAGSTTDVLGNIGPLAPHISNIEFYGSGATVYFSNNETLSVSGSFGGVTGTNSSKVVSVDPFDVNLDVGTHKFIGVGNNTSTFVMRGISASGSLVVSEDSQAIYIDSIYNAESGSADSATLTDNTLVYLKKNNQISSTVIGITSGTFYDGTLVFKKDSANLDFSKLLPRAKVKYIHPTYNTPNAEPVLLNVEDAGVFYIRTPNGICGFSGLMRPNEVTSVTLITESDDIWSFPKNVYFENGENYLTCGKSILNLTTFDQGQSWYAVVAARGIDGSTANCEVKSLYGSCCYQGLTALLCKDFITKNECDILSGTFNALVSCDVGCGSTFGVCCSNGSCIENVSYSECIAFGGKYFFGIDCNYLSNNPNGDNDTRLCFNNCSTQKIACCKDGQCLGDNFTKIECENILGGVAFVNKQCSEVDCCLQNVKVGPCCFDGNCIETTLLDCKTNFNGIFLGEGERCGNVNCSCYDTTNAIFGRCCICNGSTPTCVITTQSGCPNNSWEAVPGAVFSDTCSVQNQNFCTTNLSCTAPTTGRCCVCSGGSTTCSIKTQAECSQLNGLWNSTLTCTTPCNPCAFSPACSDCSSGGTPGVICECVTDGSGTRKVCSSIQTNDPRCLEPNVVCIPNVTCSSNPCAAGTILPGCVTNTCPGGATEQQTCPNTADIRTSSICPDCFPDGTIPPLSGVIEHNSSSSSNGFVLEPLRDIWADFGTNVVFQDGADPANPCRQALGATNPIVGKALYANSVKDVYIPIKPEYICPNGKDLQFCIQIDLPDTQLIQSFRAYILRTWYPNNFSTNYAASRGKILIGGRPVNFIDPASTSEEINVWGSIEDVEGSLLFPDGYQTLSRMIYAENLSSVLTEKGFNYIEYNPVYDDYVFNYQNLITPSFNVNTVRMIHELNCPLLGYNPRGRYIEFERATSTNPLIPPTGNPRPLLATRQNPGITYARVDDHANQYYYSSVNLGGRCGVVTNSIPNDTLILGAIDAQLYNTDSLSKFSFSSKARRYENDFPDTTLLGSTLDSRRTMGYTDLGFVKSCLVPTAGFSLCQYLTVDSVLDPDTVNGIGFYPRHATLNRFANTFTNFAFTSPGNPPQIANLLPYRFSNPGHPLMVDYESDIVVLQSFSSGLPPTTIKKHVYRYDPYNSTPLSGASVSFTNETTVQTNISTDLIINKSPIYKTRHTSIICDTGVYDNSGNYYEDTAFTYGNMATPQYSPKRKILGAIDNPWYDNPSVPGSSSRAESVISKTPTGYKLCIKLKNYKDYILTDDQLNTSDFSPYGVLKNTNISRNKRHLLYKNTLRVVLFANPLNPYTNTIFGTDPIANPPGTPGVPQDDPSIVLATYKKAAEEYVKLYYFSTALNSGSADIFNYNILKYGCTNLSCACGSSENLEGKCNACNINQFDKQTNMYGAYTVRTFYCTMRGFHSFGAYDEAGCVRISTEDGGGGGGSGLGSFLVCNCAPLSICPVAEFQQDFPVVANCRNCSHPTPCSCKGVSPSGTVYYGGGYAGCFGAQPCGQIEGGLAAQSLCKDNCSESVFFETTILGITFPWEGGCYCPSSLCGFTGQDTGGFYEEPSFSGRMRLIRSYFDTLGYVENEDYIFVNYDPPTIPETMVIFKLFSKFYPNLNNLPPHERYSFTHIAPPYLAYKRIYDAASVWPDLNIEGQGPADYIRDTICLGSAAGASLAEYIQTCGIGITLFATRLYNRQCSNFCELNGQSCVPKLFDGTDQQLYSNLLAHTLYLPPPQPPNRAIEMGASCPTTSFTGSDTYKKFFIDETDFICVNVDCSTIDCSQYQDCSP